MEFDIAGKLFPNLLTMFVQLSATGLLFYGFKRLFWKPLTVYIEKRAEAEDQALRSAKEADELAQVNLARSELAVNTASAESNEIIQKGKAEALRLKEQIVAQAKAEADAKLDAAHREIDHQRNQLRKDIETEIVDVALVAAKKLLESKVDEEHDRLAVQQIIKDVRN
jgi:F-type H+-transporting ATPase subunit b